VKGTALRPVLALLDEGEAAAFTVEYALTAGRTQDSPWHDISVRALLRDEGVNVPDQVRSQPGL
jgi:hypothetical protein